VRNSRSSRGAFSPSGGPEEPVSDVRLIAEEVPVAFSYESASYAVMIAYPRDLTDFAVGFSLNEGIVSPARDIESLDIIETDGTLLRRWLSGPAPPRSGSGGAISPAPGFRREEGGTDEATRRFKSLSPALLSHPVEAPQANEQRC
jgi:FdhD/NarQ family